LQVVRQYPQQADTGTVRNLHAIDQAFHFAADVVCAHLASPCRGRRWWGLAVDHGLHYCSGNLNKKAQKSVLINQKIKYMKQARTTWEQWQVLQCIVSEGGFAQAAKAMHRSQSSVSYMVAQLQEQLGVALLQAQGGAWC
jgi:hypothetical protein